jgi:hypothetical protein
MSVVGMINETEIQINECMALLKDAPEAKTKKHMLAFTRLLGLGSMLAYYIAHQPDAVMPTQELGEKPEELSIAGCVGICDDISSSIKSGRPTDTVRVNQIFLDVCSMMSTMRKYVPLRIVHAQPSSGDPIVADCRFEENMSGLVKAIELARRSQNLMCTETMSSPMGDQEILSQYFPGCGALGAPTTPTTPAAKRTLTWGDDDVPTDDARDIEGNADGDTEDDGNVEGDAEGDAEGNAEPRNLKRARTECIH